MYDVYVEVGLEVLKFERNVPNLQLKEIERIVPKFTLKKTYNIQYNITIICIYKLTCVPIR
jgi:hypothetical protein